MTLQDDLNSIINIISALAMKVNTNKTNLLSRNASQLDLLLLTVDRTPVERVDTYKYLGLQVSSNLLENKHIQKVINDY